MIETKKTTEYYLRCNKCSKVFTKDGHNCFYELDSSLVTKAARNLGWYISEDKHICAFCFENACKWLMNSPYYDEWLKEKSNDKAD